MFLKNTYVNNPAKLQPTNQSISSDTFDEFFYHWWVDFSKIWDRQNELHLLKQHLLVSNSQTVVDVGCADMYLFSQTYLPGLKNLYGVEPNIHLCEEAKKGNPLAKLYNSYGENLPFQDNFADLILCLWVLHLVDSIPSVTNELRRVCKPEGTILITVPDLNSQLYDIFYEFSKTLFPAIDIPTPNKIIQEIQEVIFEQFLLDKVNIHSFIGTVTLPRNKNDMIAPISVFVHWFLKKHFTLAEIFKAINENIELLNNLPMEFSDRGLFFNVKLSD